MKYRKGVAGESNDDDGSTKRGRDATPSIQVEIAEYHGGGGGGGGLGNGGGGSASFFEPWREATPGSGSGHGSSGRGGGGREPPEKRLTLFSLRLAVLEKAASGLGMLDFMWATVVLLGGFASALKITDFWCVTVILVGEGARVFGRSHELEWQHHSTLTSTAGSALRSSSRLFRRLVHALDDPAAATVTGGARGQDARDRAAQFQRQIVAFMKQRAWHAPDVSLLPYTGWVFVSKKIGRLLNWLQEEEVRWCAAQVVSKLAGKRQNALRVSGIPGAIESVMSLLYAGWSAPVSATPHDVSPAARRSYDHPQFNLLGLLILKRLARDHDNCGKIGNTRGLLAKIIEFTHASPALLRNTLAPESQVRAVKLALKVVKILVSTTGSTGKMLRRGVAENVFTVSSLRVVLQHGQQHRALQKLATDILSGLAMDDKGKQVIVGTGGVVKQLLSIFVDAETELGGEAGEALAMLALESEASCAAILKRDDVLDHLVSALEGDGGARRLNAARVLRNLCAYAGEKHRPRLSAVIKAMPVVLKATMTGSDKILEVSVGLTTQICKFIDGDRFADELRGAGIDERAYVERLASILREHRYPVIRVPRMRRFIVQQVIWLMTSSSSADGGGGGGGGANYVSLLREAGMERLLESIADTTSELECYHVFSGSVGISKHRESFSAAVDAALELLGGDGRSSS
ncbi:hypothetical protein OsI_11667 [Oryza sativa Indica Group]|uniref:Uncharacterized protein n=1 Tax=Oryza sativa subsp. indica TaxID=39946 RepID=A2XGZ1_ORYSI|nr:hypothetical protein OsI_11667 [Oryza sativa Indica Group]